MLRWWIPEIGLVERATVPRITPTNNGEQSMPSGDDFYLKERLTSKISWRANGNERTHKNLRARAQMHRVVKQALLQLQ